MSVIAIFRQLTSRFRPVINPNPPCGRRAGLGRELLSSYYAPRLRGRSILIRQRSWVAVPLAAFYRRCQRWAISVWYRTSMTNQLTEPDAYTDRVVP